ncbi:PepSY domain-containing protein [Falsirhodobacter xinxiangensis]|uniref:PepSY domain-containing protein n=1 Tax=Falsirhodobacter xinxiangensis TaxID=2530049 RepID=UPI0010AB2479|nr:PepSY domain-containing protein [Rhodobacter xinxiangensis]
MIRATLLALFLALPAHAHDDPARLAEHALPIDRALSVVAGRYEGRMIAAELTEDDDRPVYDFRWLTPQGNVLRIRLDAATGRFLLVDGVGQTEARILP